jgi:proton-coupled amino acid transporter
VSDPPPSSADALSPSPSPSPAPQLSDAQKAEVIRKHLLSADEQHRLASDQALQSGFSLPKSGGGGGGGLHSSFSLGGAFPQEQARQQETSEEYPTPYHLEGGDVVAGVYKWAAQQAEAHGGASVGSPGAMGTSYAGSGATPAMRRSKSMDTIAAGEGLTSRRTSHAAQGGAADRATFRAGLEGAAEEVPEEPSSAIEFSREEMLQPGGFRRDFVFRNKLGGVVPSPAAGTPGVTSEASSEVNASGVSLVVPNGPGRGHRPTRSFIDFLSLYGHFGGEDLEEIEEEDEEDSLSEEDEEAIVGAIPPFQGGGGANERTPLIRNRSTARTREGSRAKRLSKAEGGQGKEQGDATVTQAVMMLLKSFVGTGVLFLGKAYVSFSSHLTRNAELMTGKQVLQRRHPLLCCRTLLHRHDLALLLPLARRNEAGNQRVVRRCVFSHFLPFFNFT